MKLLDGIYTNPKVTENGVILYEQLKVEPDYTVMEAGLPVEQSSSDSVGSIPTSGTKRKFLDMSIGKWMGRIFAVCAIGMIAAGFAFTGGLIGVGLVILWFVFFGG